MTPSPSPQATLRRAGFRRALLPALLASLFSTSALAADLLTITRDALNNNAELASARSLSDSVEAGRDVERGDLRPQLNAQGNVTHTRQFESQTATGAAPGDDRFTSAGVTLEATQALFDARNRRELERAEREIDQQLYRLAATEQQVLIDVATAYFNILRAHEILEARRAQERAIGRQLEQAQEQFEVGLIAITEVQEARASFDQSRAERITAESNLQVSFEALERLTGQRYGEVDTLGEGLPIAAPTPAGRDHWVTLAMENNPLVLASRAGVEVSRSTVEVARAGHLPTLNAFANYQYSDSDRDNLSGHDSRAQVGIGVNLPLYTGGRTQAGIRQSSFLLESSQYDFEAQRRDTVQRVRSLYTQVSNDVSTVEARAQAIVSNQSALEATRAGYEVGTRNIVDVLNAERSLFDAIANHAEARYDYVLNLLTLRQQSGVLDLGSIEEINGWLASESIRLSLPDEGAHEAALNIGAPPRLDD
ncbi:TolC family outer membrane protein [Halomonas sp. 328]|uniref:TolC family outer membrane protein n=1 Tax=Halomonas sp. 328 TaxID=2776704 RepID=UPI0018A770D7|nr:TolC family outer membrane protein [Halomonas sp. 328]MBF8222424.1 TolC family outer membrane protein [Halomonas sp. 328]